VEETNQKKMISKRRAREDAGEGKLKRKGVSAKKKRERRRVGQILSGLPGEREKE
jgi:hypothetical protein